MRLGRCVIRDYGYVGCHADILVHMDAQCSGNTACEVRIPDAVLDRTNPCPKDFKTYLEVSYECVPGTVLLIIYMMFYLDKIIIILFNLPFASMKMASI